MLPSARTNDAFCSGLLYVVLHFRSFHPESGWCMEIDEDAEVGRLHRGGCHSHIHHTARDA